MNWNGNKIVTASALLFAINMANAEAPNLVEFTSGTAAKASEVNANFESLNTYSASLENLVEAQATLIAALEEKATAADTSRTALEEKVSALETESDDLQNQIANLSGGDAYTIAVYGDGELIGYTDYPKISNDKQYMILKTEHGMASLKPSSGEYILNDYDELSDDADSNSIHYTDAVCSQAVTVLASNPISSSMLFTKEAGVLDTPRIATNGDSIYLAAKGTEFSNVSISFYSKNDEGDCIDSYDYLNGSFYIPVVEMTEESHGLKPSYSSISIEGYETN